MQNLFFETIRISEGRIANLSYHQARLERTHQAHFPHHTPPRLSDYLKEKPFAGLYRAKVIYAETVREVRYFPYTPKVLQRFTLVESNIRYPYKRLDRTLLESLKQCSDCDEVVIVQNGLLTDTTISNIAVYDGSAWYTPQQPLLEGTVRANLIDRGVLKPAKIRPKDLKHFCDFAVMNAMLGFRVLKRVRIIDQNGLICFYKEGYDKR